ncbi:MAG: hypothetical protein ACLRWQ_18180 [Flavonifractor plautii]
MKDVHRRRLLPVLVEEGVATALWTTCTPPSATAASPPRRR